MVATSFSLVVLVLVASWQVQHYVAAAASVSTSSWLMVQGC